MYHACAQGKEGGTPTRQRATPTRSQEEEEAGNPPELQCAHLAHNMQERERERERERWGGT